MPRHDLIVIGAGPGGYVAAIRAAQLGLDVANVEKEEALGGTCVRVGCIPSKALLESSHRYQEAREGFAGHGVEIRDVSLDLGVMMARKDRVVKSNTDGVAYLFRKNKVKRYRGLAEITAPGKVTVHSGDGDQTLEADNIVIATGSSVATLRGVEPDGDRIGTSTEALAYQEVPERLVVIGAGYIGLELGSVWQRLGSRVTVLEYLDRILPGMDAEIAREALDIFRKQGIEFHLGAKVTGATVAGDEVVVEVQGRDPFRCDRLLLATGRRPNTEGLGLAALGVELDQHGRVVVDERFRTSVDGVYAIGDVIRGPMLAHKAEEEGVAVAEILATGHGHVSYDTVPGIVYTEPEIATVGKTEEQLEEAGVAYAKGVFPYQANGRARALGATGGKVKVLADAMTDRILGVHIIGARAGDLIAEAVVAIAFGASSEDLARTIHAHPTLAEILKEAALAVEKRAIHI
jgi:dihydrolipoamide dehydrogenase